MPNRLEIDNSIHSYRYAADGRKLRVQQGEDYRDYVGNFVYENGSLKRILVEGGYIEDGKYYFYLNDHLGNNSVVADQDGETVQRNSYYPFGLPMAEASTEEQEAQPYKYNGKEFERKDGLKLYDYHARQYDAAVGRFTMVDPMAEDYYGTSPYAYVMNNPIKHIDPDGRSTWVVQNEDGTYRVVGGDINNNDQNIYVIQDMNDMFAILDTGKTGNSIGESLTTHSFYDTDTDGFVLGTTIDTQDRSGVNFIHALDREDPELTYYMENATRRGIYDFKTIGMEEETLPYKYRGMQFSTKKDGTPIYASARDVGNYGAGFIAGKHGISWGTSRVAFDQLESKQKGYPAVEGLTTQLAQAKGWQYGYAKSLTSPISTKWRQIRSIIPAIKYINKKYGK